MFRKSMFAMAAMCVLATSQTAPAQVVLSGGSSVLNLNQAQSAASTPVTTVTGLFGNSETRTFILAAPDGTGMPSFPFPPATPLPLAAAVNIGSFVNPEGRTIQSSTLNYDPSNLFGTWAPATDLGAFVSGGEQIGLEGMTRWTGAFPGTLLFGDFAIRYSPSRVGVVRNGNTLSGLVLTSNIDFANAAYADIANATISSNPSLLSISGDLVYSDGFATLTGDPTDAGVLFGTFSLTATPVPEPTSMLFAAVGGAAFVVRRLRRRPA